MHVEAGVVPAWRRRRGRVCEGAWEVTYRFGAVGMEGGHARDEVVLGGGHLRELFTPDPVRFRQRPRLLQVAPCVPSMHLESVAKELAQQQRGSHAQGL